MSISPHRRLNLLDGMILIAGLALGISLTRYLVDGANPYYSIMTNPSFSGSPNSGYSGLYLLNEKIRIGISLVTIWLVVLSPTILLIRLRRPHPIQRKVFREPGTSAACSATLMIALETITLIPAVVLDGRASLINLLYSTTLFETIVISKPYFDISATVGLSIGLLWLMIVFSGRWIAERNAFDRAGRVLGVCWILVFLCTFWLKLNQSITRTESMVQTRKRLELAEQQAEQRRPIEEANHRKYAQEMQQYFQDKQAWLDNLLQAREPDQIKKYFEGQIESLHQEIQTFEAEEKAKLAPPPGLSPFHG